jgi:hypothetical protein
VATFQPVFNNNGPSLPERVGAVLCSTDPVAWPSPRVCQWHNLNHLARACMPFDHLIMTFGLWFCMSCVVPWRIYGVIFGEWSILALSDTGYHAAAGNYRSDL